MSLLVRRDEPFRIFEPGGRNKESSNIRYFSQDIEMIQAEQFRVIVVNLPHQDLVKRLQVVLTWDPKSRRTAELAPSRW